MISDQKERRRRIEGQLTWLEFLDSEFASLAVSADGFVDSSIGSTTDEPDYFVSVYNSDFTLIPDVWSNTPITWVWAEVSVQS